MAIKVNLGVSKKVGMPDYGSTGASCNLELEVDPHLLDTDLDGFHERVRAAYIAAQQAVQDQIRRLQGPPPVTPADDGGRDAANGHPSAHAASRAHAGTGVARSSGGTSRPPASSGRRDKPATNGQVKAIFGIARQIGADLGGLLAELGVEHPRDLSIGAASALIDQLKSIGAR
jgi:hypothetical protein